MRHSPPCVSNYRFLEVIKNIYLCKFVVLMFLQTPFHVYQGQAHGPREMEEALFELERVRKQ